MIVLTVVGAWWFSGGEWFFGLLALLIMWGSVGPFFVTTRFVIDAAGVEVDSPFLKRKRAWTDIKTWFADRDGATLSPFAGRSWLEAYRSVRLMWGDREDEIRRRLHEKLGEPSR
jgi:hypothetical protein